MNITYELLQKIKGVFRYLGLEISFYNPSGVFINQFMTALKYNKIDLIIDVGANEGQFALESIHAGYNGSIISIEPLTGAYGNLLKNSKKYKNWIVFPRMAVGDKNHLTYINVSQNSVSSSILDMTPRHLNSAPDSKYVKREKVKVFQLDNFINKFKEYEYILLKIDAQGYESFVLKGAKKLLLSKNLKGIFIEVSFSELYKNQKMFDYFYKELKNKGFNIWALEDELIEKSTGKLLQANLFAFK